MKITLLVAESVSIHPDGTFSLLRGGLTHFWNPSAQNIMVGGTVLVYFQADPHESGDHEFSLVLFDADGKKIGPELKGRFTVPDGGGTSAVALKFETILPKHGTYAFSVVFDKIVHERWTFVVEPPRTKKEGG